MNPKILPTVLMIIDFGAALPYFCCGDWKRGIYWIDAVMNLFYGLLN